MLHVYNTLTRQKEPFKPLKDGEVGMYLCGPTVYDHAHLGHGRSAVAFDVIRRYLEYVYGQDKVRFVTNYTDIDDKMIHRATEDGITVKQLAEKIIPEYEADYDALGITPPTVQTKATDPQYIEAMIDIVTKLVEKGHAYELEDGVYFDISTFKAYGKLSGQKQDELQSGARVETDTRKRHPHDFVLWKKEKPGEPSWESPWGKGRPGWHIECSAMSRVELGQPFDIHAGGMDLTFPHHECEIAQSEAAYNTPFCNVWLHNGFITVNKEKMSKSLGNFFTLKDIFKKYDPRVVRLFYLRTHYRSPIEFSDGQLEQAKNTFSTLHNFTTGLQVNQVEEFQCDEEIEENDLKAMLNNLTSDFEEAMSDDFDTPRALASIFNFLGEIYQKRPSGMLKKENAEMVMNAFKKIDTVLGIFNWIDLEKIFKEIKKEAKAIHQLLENRKEAKNQKNFQESDRIREEIATKHNLKILDMPNGGIAFQFNK